MAAPMSRGLSCLSRALGWWSRQPVLVTQSIAVVPVRTKKRFTPPTYEPKYKSEKEFVEHFRKAGVVIPPERLERPIHLACTGGIFDPYVPPEGDARVSSLSKEGLAQKTERWKKNVASQLSVRKIREYDANFKIKEFPEKAKDIFIEAHLCLNKSPLKCLVVSSSSLENVSSEEILNNLSYEHAPREVLCVFLPERGYHWPGSFSTFIQGIIKAGVNDMYLFFSSDHDRLHTLATENCFPDMVWDLQYKTVRWSFVESLEPAQVVQVRCSSMVNQGNVYGQVTVRMHTRQTLAIYDRFGRLMYGQEDVPKDVLEYVVFEKHLTNPYGSWRMHGKIVPAWAPPKQPILKTVMIPGPQLKPGEDYEEPQAEAHKSQLA